MRIVDGHPVPDPGESPIWDGTQWLYAPPLPGLPGPRGKGGGCGTAGPPGPQGPAGPPAQPLVTPFQMTSVPTATTTGPGPVTFMTVTVNVLTPGDVLIQFNASVEVETLAPGSTNFQGAAFSLLWDGAPIPPVAPSAVSQNAFMEFDNAALVPSPDTFSNGVNIVDVVLAAPIGPHTLEVQFEGFDALSKVDVFDGSGTLVVQTKPL